MWLPKDERRLLQGYYLKISDVEKEVWFDTTCWIPVMNSRPSTLEDNTAGINPYFSGSNSKVSGPGLPIVEQVKQYISDKTRLDVANKALAQRGLIRTHKHQHEPDVAAIALTISGYDLGRKYNSWLSRSGLWFAEYKDHWFWLILSFLGGIIGALIVNWLSK